MSEWRETKDGGYQSTTGEKIDREYGTITPGGNTTRGQWVYRNASGSLVDFDLYRHDLFERNGIRIVT